MVKINYIIRGVKGEDYILFKKRIFNLLSSINSKHQLKNLSVVLTEASPPLLSIIPFTRKKIAVVTLKNEASIDIFDIKKEEGYVGSYTVKEALPVHYEKSWSDGNVTPGICLLTLFNQKKNISYEHFINIWHNSHTPLSLKLHPLWSYNRNVVIENGQGNIEKWDGIVEEHVQNKKELLNPFLFFGRPGRIIQNMIAVYKDTKAFIDYPSMQPYLTQEYHIKS